jgi:glycosyltransferase involved in cell wall biosynthesis
MEKVIVFDTELNGHHLEYINHIYLEAVNNHLNTYIFIIPEEFLDLKSKLHWPSANNIKFDFLISDEILIKKKSLLKESFLKSKLLKQKIKQHNADRVFLIMLIQFLPFLPFLLKKIPVKVSGIIYLVYLYRWKNASFLLKCLDVFKYLLLTKFLVFDKIYILNDKSSALYLNKQYQTNKFYYLPDPFVLQTLNKSIKYENLKIDEEAIVFLHFGALTERKGSMDILQAISLMNTTKNIKPLCFIFAGQVMNDIKNDFYSLIESVNNDVKIYVYDEFCSYEFIGYLCNRSDYILIPYKNVLQSSGVIAYASYYKKPVIGPYEGLLGKLIRKYKLGITLKAISPESLIIFFENVSRYKSKVSQKYLENNTITNFQKILFNDNI